MVQLIEISLENEMDLILAHRRSMGVGELLGLTISTQTTFATAVSEISRSVIEHTDNGKLIIGLEQQQQRYALRVLVIYASSVKFTNADEGFYYAQKLVPEFNLREKDGRSEIEMKIGLPRSLNLTPAKIAGIKASFLSGAPINAYEEIKQRNHTLSKLSIEQEEELRRSKIIDEKRTEFISIASHEIKTPITIIKAYTQMAKSAKDGCNEKVYGLLDKIDQQTTKLVNLVQQLMDVSRIENGSLIYNLETVALTDFIHEMIMIMANILPEHELKALEHADVDVRMDKLRMEQVFFNLIGNAAKYSKGGTVIEVSSRKLTDNLVEVTIADQGLGMSSADAKKIFEKFYRVEEVVRTHAGLGMGLYISSKIITDHGGQIKVDSELGVGSSFSFTLPIRQ
jgi:signal transduction histidine kinase